MINLKKLLGFILVLMLVTVSLCTISFASEVQYTENVIPAMTSNTAPSGVARESSFWSDSGKAWRAFNHSCSDVWATSEKITTGWLEYDFPEAKCISKYTLVSRNPVISINELPRDWTFEGWDKQLSKWIVLDTRKNVTDWKVGAKKEFKFLNKNLYNKYRINITANTGFYQYVAIGEMEMMEVLIPKVGAPINLTATANNAKINLSWSAVEGATSYNIKRSTLPDGTYSTIATSSAITYTDTSAVNGTAYYYVVTAVNSNGESENSNEVTAMPANLDVTLEVTSADKTKVGDLITANVVIHNAANICAEDIKVAFDTSKLEFISAKGAEGIKIYKEDSLTEGIRRYITASLGKANAANGDKILLQLTFKAKAPGEAKIDITNGRIADNSTLEKDIEEKNCGEKIVLIEEKSKDVNRSGEFTLLDLGIDAWYYGDAAANTDPSKYDADVVANGTIDDDDLAEIVKQILNNSNYPVASK